jgi:uncharacterized protein with PIN domain
MRLFNKYKQRCEFCGESLMNEKCYTVREKVPTGFAALSSEEPTLLDAVDCPKCGRQRLIGVRARAITNRQERKYEDNSIICGDSHVTHTEPEC